MIVAHDLGTTGDKASLHDDEGRLVAAVTVHYDTRFDRGGVAEQDPEAWWAAVWRRPDGCWPTRGRQPRTYAPSASPGR